MAINNLVGFRILPNLWVHYRAGNAVRKEAPLNTVADLLESAGRMRAPLLDTRQNIDSVQGETTWRMLTVKYVRACGREIRIRMFHSRTLSSEYEMRALMDK